MALIPIVDKSDNLLMYKERSEVLAEDIYRVSAMWLINEKGEVLVAKRALSKAHDPGKWATSVAGTVEGEETYEENIRKEMQEELGIEAEPVMGSKVLLEGEHRMFCQWFHAVIPSDTAFTLQEEEVAEVRWFSREELNRELEENPVRWLVGVKRFLEALPEFA